MPIVPIVPNSDYLLLTGKTFANHPNQRRLRTLCGDDPPTLTAGYALWSIIPRPLFQGLTVPQGFAPAQLKVSLRFGIWDGRYDFNGWDTSNLAGETVEEEIDDLHWMAGGNAIAGTAPAVYIDAFDANDLSKRIDLVPRQYRTVAWVIYEGIEWGKAIRNPSGFRVYQDASFVLLGYLGIGASPPKESVSSGSYVQSSGTANTILKVVNGVNAANSLALADVVAAAPQNNPCRASRLFLERKSFITFKLPLGTWVWIPGVTA